MDIASNALQSLQSMMKTHAHEGRTQAEKQFKQTFEKLLTQRAPTHEGEVPEGYKAAQQLIATSFFQPMLDQMMDSPLKSDFLDGGSAERIFKQQWHTHLADDVVTSAARFDPKTNQWTSPSLPLVDSVFQQITRGQTAISTTQSHQIDKEGQS